ISIELRCFMILVPNFLAVGQLRACEARVQLPPRMPSQITDELSDGARKIEQLLPVLRRSLHRVNRRRSDQCDVGGCDMGSVDQILAEERYAKIILQPQLEPAKYAAVMLIEPLDTILFVLFE